jgi:RNA polymerase sigma factor (sigma-70 family)
MMANSDWSGLMAAAQAGNGGAYRRLLEEVRVWLRRYYARRLPPSMIDDAAQDTLIAIHQKRHTYDPSRPFEAWLAAIARYKWIDRLRDMKRNACEALTEEIEVTDHETAVISATVLEALLVQLKPAQSAAIRLVKLQGLSVEETAAKTGQSASLVKVNIHRGLAKLATMIQSEEAAHG